MRVRPMITPKASNCSEEQDQQLLLLPDRSYLAASIVGWGWSAGVGGAGLCSATLVFLACYFDGAPVLGVLVALPFAGAGIAMVIAGGLLLRAVAKHRVIVSLNNATIRKVSRWRQQIEYPILAVAYANFFKEVDGVRIYYQTPSGQKSIYVMVSADALIQLAHPSERWPGIDPESLAAAGFPHRLGRKDRLPRA